jgi:hypothetical protein
VDLVHPQTAAAANAGGDSMENLTFMMFMMGAAVILYLIRPNSLRRRNNEGAKSPRDDVRFLFHSACNSFSFLFPLSLSLFQRA